MTNIDRTTNPADELGVLLAQIADMTKRADKIKAAMKEAGVKVGGITEWEGSLFKSTLVEANRDVVDFKKLVNDHGLTAYVPKYTTVTSVFSIRTTSR